jgi:tetratricopeptide (TPR) repeat protein
MTLEQQLESGMSHHRAGRLDQARASYLEALALDPSRPEPLDLLGVIAIQTGQFDEAIEWIRQAIAINPRVAGYHSHLGNALHGKGQHEEAIAAWRVAIGLNPGFAEAYADLGNALREIGRLKEAVEACRQAVRLDPNSFVALNNLGAALQDPGQLDEAIAAYRQALRINPNLAETHNNLGNALLGKGQPDEAITEFQLAVQLKPESADIHRNLGTALYEKGRLDEAIAAHRQAIRLKPDYADAYNNLGLALTGKGKLEEAIACYRQAIRLKADFAEAYNNLGNALRNKEQLDEAITAYRQAIRLKPDFAEAHSNLCLLAEMGQLDEAIAACRRAIVINPNFPEAHKNLSLILLVRGDFQQGWEEYEWRWKCKDFPPPRNFAQPQWDGCPLEGRTILLHTEQGLGDAIQFIRYLPLVEQRGGKIIIECQAVLQRLFQTMAGGCQVVVRGQPLSAFDLHCALLSLPRVFRTNLADIPNIVPYLHADAGDAGRWQHRLAEHSPFAKVGLGWAGNPRYDNDRNRSIKLARLAPLGQIPGARFFSLQKGEAAAEAKTPPAGMELIDWTQELEDFADTAGLIENLDLVVTVDTAVAHLAGAMGKPTWVLLPFSPDWRWLLDREDSPWYPTMRLFRQPTRGAWGPVLQNIAAALKAHVSRSR